MEYFNNNYYSLPKKFGSALTERHFNMNDRCLFRNFDIGENFNYSRFDPSYCLLMMMSRENFAVSLGLSSLILNAT